MEPGSRCAAVAGADDEVGFVVLDGGNEAREIGDDVGAVAVHVDEDGAGGERGVGAGETGGSVATGGCDDAGAGGQGDGGGRVGAAVVDDDALGDEGQGIAETTWPMDSASFSAGMMTEMGGGIVFFSGSDY